MSRITTPTPESNDAATAEIYAQIRKAAGGVPNTFAVIGAYKPAALKAILQADGVLAGSTLSKQDQETIKLLVSEIAGCDYCVAPHTFLGNTSAPSPEHTQHIAPSTPPADTHTTP